MVPGKWVHLTVERRYAMLKKMLYMLGVTLLFVFSNAQAAQCDAACVAGAKALAKQGNALAQFVLGGCYDFGECEGIPQDYVKARWWYEKAAVQGNAEAQFNLGLMYRKGEGVRQDYVKARQWYEKAAKQGHAQAQNNLGFMYDHGKGVRQNKRTAKEWFGKACDNGDQMGCDNYRKLNERGF